MFSATYLKEYKTNFKIALPVIIGQVGHMASQIADNVMVGNLGATILAASSFAGMLFLIILLMLIGLSTAVTTLIGNSNGAGDSRKSFEILGNSFWATLGFSTVSVLILLGIKPYLYLLGQDPEVVKIALPYYSVLCWSAIPLVIFLCLKNFVEGLEWTLPGMYISIFANIINILLNYLLINGHLGFDAYGIEGAGYATLISRIFMALAMLGLLIFHPKLSFYRNALTQFRWNVLRLIDLFKVGIPIGLQYLLEGGAFIVGTFFIGWLGAEHLAAHQIALSLASLTFMIATGLSAAATIRISNLVGAKKFSELKTVSYSLLTMIIAIESAFALAMILFKEWLPTFYVNEPDVILVAGNLLVIAAFFQISDGIQVLAMGALRGISDVIIPTAIALISYWLVSIPIGYYLMKEAQLSSNGIWFGFLAGLSLAALLLGFRSRFLMTKLIKEHHYL